MALQQNRENPELHAVTDRIPPAFLTLDSSWRCTHANSYAGSLLLCAPDELIGKPIWNALPAGVGDPLLHSAEIAMQQQRPMTIESRWTSTNRWIRSRIYPSPNEVMITFFDVTDRRWMDRLAAGHGDVLAGIAAHQPLHKSLKRIAELHEELNPGALCSVLLLDAGGTHLQHGAAPSLPEAYNRAIHGVAIGEAQGSCGTAIWKRERVIVADIATHPYWVDFRDIALAHNLCACWSTPVLGSRGQVLGSFAVYYHEAREPGADELEYIDKMLPIAAIAIESAQLIERVSQREAFFDLSLEVYCVFDTATERIVQANSTFTKVTGYTEAELSSCNYIEFVHPEDRPVATSAVAELNAAGGRVHDVVYRFKCKDGGYRWLSWESLVAADGKAFAVAHDVTERRTAEAELAHAARHDALTRLPHRLTFEQLLGVRVAGAKHDVWVLLLGIDRFQAVNELMGHLVGDDVLLRIAGRLRKALGDSGDLARFGGDQYAIAVSMAEHAEVIALAAQLRAAVAQPIETGEYRLLLTASVGISRSPNHGHTPQELLIRAEAAVRRAKRRGKDNVCEFSFEQMADIEDRLVLGKSLRGAIERGEMELHYQPQHDTCDETLIGFEALLRWDAPGQGQVSPTRLIQIAETLGLMPEVGTWVVGEACRQARVWLDRGHRGFNIAVNISAQELQRPGLVAMIRDALKRHNVPADVLSIELTESSLMENVERVRNTLAELRNLGMSLSLDDFGTGYSSLAYLKHFPIDKLKIDQRFVRGLPDNADDAAIARTIIAMGHQLHMVVAAEGVETAAQATFLRDIGCDILQGYFLGRPLPAESAEQFFPDGVIAQFDAGSEPANIA